MPRQLVSIQALRALAALAVTIAHTWSEIGWIVVAYLHKPYTLPGMVTGAVGVDLFFVISGFVMVYSTAKLFGSASGAVTFATRRLIRIVPIYWLVTIVQLWFWFKVFGTGLEQNYESWSHIFWSSLFVSMPRSDGATIPFIAPGWSLNFEMFFYAVFAVCLLLPRRIAIVGLCLFLYWLAFRSGWIGWPPAVAFLCNPILMEFVYGIVIGFALLEGIRLPRAVALMMLATGFLMIAATAVSATEIPREYVWAPGSALIVAGAVFAGDPRPSKAWGFKIWGFLTLLGDSSYVLYLTHGMVMGLFRSAFLGVGVWLSQWPWVLVAAMTAASVAVAIVVHLRIERPMTNALRGMIGRRRPVNARIEALADS